MTTAEQLRRLGACNDAIEWVEDRPCVSAYALWRSCPDGSWLLWLAARVDVDKRLVVRAACACAREALVYVSEGEERPRVAIKAAEAWTRGEASLEDVRRAATAACALAYNTSTNALAYNTSTNALAYAAYAAAYAAASAAASAAAYAASAAAYAYAYAAAHAADALAASLATSARHVRRGIPWRIVRDALGAEVAR